MKYLEYKEHRRHGTFDFPFAFYPVGPNHPRYNMQYHWHTEQEILRVLSGQLALTIDDRSFVLTAGDMAYIPGGCLHSGVPSGCSYECLVFDLDYFLKQNNPCAPWLMEISSHEKNIRPLFPAANQQAAQMLAPMFEAMASRSPGYQLIVPGCLSLFLGTVIRESWFDDPKPLSSGNQKRIKQLKAVLSFISTHYQEDLTLTDLADCAHMNRNYFCRYFQELTHQSPIHYLNYYRTEAACEQLTFSDRSITEIALDCGFKDPSYFVKVFRRFKGVTPSEYLHRLRSSAPLSEKDVSEKGG